jgi:TM2 domain-containing membrane protein YozV
MESKFCHSCGEQIAKSAPTCPKCGAPQAGSVSMALSANAPRSKTIAVVLALLLGGFGAHKFYLRRHVSGVLYLLFCWTYIPAFLALGEGLRYALIKDETFDAAYNGGQPSNQSAAALKVVGIIVAGFMVVMFVGILAAILLPAYHDYVQRAKARTEATVPAETMPDERTYAGITGVNETSDQATDVGQFIVGYGFNHGQTADTLHGTEFRPDHRYVDFTSVKGEDGRYRPTLVMIGTYRVHDGSLTMLRAAMFDGLTGKWTRINGGYSMQKVIRADSTGFDLDAGRNFVDGQEKNGGRVPESYRNPRAIDVQAMNSAFSDIPADMFIAQGVPPELLQ